MKEIQIINSAIEMYKPIKILLLFSGGHDSLCSTHYCANYLKSIGLDFEIYHGNTGIGIKQTFAYVKFICKKFGWKLNVGVPPSGETYRDIVLRWGFPKSTYQGHQMCYIRLKERALRAFVTHKCKSKPYARENVLLLTGIRKSESRIRMGYVEETRKEASRVWSSPIFYWEEQDIDSYMAKHSLPRNPVKDKLCISGECLCGAFEVKELLAEIKECYPETYNEIQNLKALAKERGLNDIWGGVSAYKPKRKVNKRQLNMFMCIGCEDKFRESPLIGIS